MDNLLEFFTVDDVSIDKNIHQIMGNMMVENTMTCLLQCKETISYGIYTIYPEGGLYISYAFW